MERSLNAIEANGLSKAFGKIKALEDVGFTVPRESLFSILGPNGAGKTTLLRILTTVTRPDSGTVRIEGLNVLTQLLEVRQLIGVVAQENRLDKFISIWHNLTMHAQMHGMKRYDYEQRISELLEKIGLYNRRFSLPEELSGGMQRRVVLIRALIHRPKILFLDEPTTGLDPQARLEIWKTIEQFKRSATVVLTTHYMEEADRLSDKIMMINNGKIVAEGTAHQLKQTISPLDRYELLLKSPKAKEYADILNRSSSLNSEKEPIVKRIKIFNKHKLEFQLSKPENLENIVKLIEPEDFFRLGQVEADLEDVFISLASSRFTEERGEADATSLS